MADWQVSSELEPFYREARHRGSVDLPWNLEAVASGGLAVRDGLVTFGTRPVASPPPPSLDAFQSEWWWNDVHLQSSLEPSDPGWRLEVTTWGITLIDRLIAGAESLEGFGFPVQFLFNLQSSPKSVNPDSDFAVGHLCVYGVREARDDMARDLSGPNAFAAVTISP